MAELGRKEAERLIKEILTEYARKIRSAKKKEYTSDVQHLFSPDIDAFYKLVKSEDMDFCIFNRLNDEGIRQLLVGCRRLAKCYELDSYGKIKDFTYEPETSKCRIASDSGGKYTAGGSYTFTLEGKAELGNKWYEPYRVVWHFYRENPGTGKYEETTSKMDEARALVDFDTWNRSVLVSEKGRYKVTATIFNQAITTGIRPDIVEVCELYFEAEDDTDAAVANLKDYEKVFRAIKLANYGDAFESLGKDIAAIALTLVAFVGIGVILKKVPAGKLKPFLKKLAEKLAVPELMAFFGTYGDAFDIMAFIEAVCDFYEQATNARNETQLKEAAKTFERVVEAFGLVAVMGFMNAVGHKMKKADVENEIELINKKSPEEILREAGYKRQSLIDQNVATIEKLQFELPDDELIKILTKMKKKGLEKSIEHVNKIIDVIDNIHVTNRSLVINNAETIRELKKYYSTQEITDILNNVSAENFEATIKKMTDIQKQLLSKQISSGETNKFARELLTELELKHGISEERLNVLRNLDYNKMSKADYEKLKPEIDAIISLTRSYDLNKVKPGKMRKYIPVEDIDKYISGQFGNRSYDGIRGFIARQDDALQLKTFDDIFYTMRLDYEGNTFIYNREIAYIDFTSTSYKDTFVPIGELYGGTENWSSPFGGMGLLKTENGQIIREYVSRGKDLKFSNMEEAVMYKIDKNGKVEQIAVYDNDIKCWVRK